MSQRLPTVRTSAGKLSGPQARLLYILQHSGPRWTIDAPSGQGAAAWWSAAAVLNSRELAIIPDGRNFLAVSNKGRQVTFNMDDLARLLELAPVQLAQPEPAILPMPAEEWRALSEQDPIPDGLRLPDPWPGLAEHLAGRAQNGITVGRVTSVRKTTGATFYGPVLPLGTAHRMARMYQEESNKGGGRFDYGVSEGETADGYATEVENILLPGELQPLRLDMPEVEALKVAEGQWAEAARPFTPQEWQSAVDRMREDLGIDARRSIANSPEEARRVLALTGNAIIKRVQAPPRKAPSMLPEIPGSKWPGAFAVGFDRGYRDPAAAVTFDRRITSIPTAAKSSLFRQFGTIGLVALGFARAERFLSIFGLCRSSRAYAYLDGLLKVSGREISVKGLMRQARKALDADPSLRLVAE